VFLDNHYKATVNGSLWTLPIEIRCYALIFLAGLLGLLSTRWRTLALAVVVFTLAGFQPQTFSYLAAAYDNGLRLPLLFVTGAVVYANREHIPIDWRGSLIGLGLVALVLRQLPSEWWIIKQAAFYSFFLYTLLVFAASPRLKRFQPPGDYSYGIYIYGFLVQQSVAHYLPALSSYPSLLLSMPIAVVLAAISWTLLERHALTFARNICTKGSSLVDEARSTLSDVSARSPSLPI
jgi:peptidoglycan/LPS O-acetylase OafA/YrhL